MQMFEESLPGGKVIDKLEIFWKNNKTFDLESVTSFTRQLRRLLLDVSFS